MSSIVEISGLVRRYRRTTALNNVSLTIPTGGVVGLVGENGAGKTTLIRHILGLLRAQEGTVRVFGLDPTKHPQEVLGRIGYLSEHRDLPGWMRIDELMRYTRALYPHWDAGYAQELLKTFELDPAAKIKTLSMGQTAKAGLLTALAHRPDFLVLDEPSSGLDPIVRRDILGAAFRAVAHEGRTVLFSSHILHEVETIADSVVMISAGKVILDSPREAVIAAHSKLVLQAAPGLNPKERLPRALHCEQMGETWTIICDCPVDDARAAAQSAGCTVLEAVPAPLDDIFVARAGRRLSEAE